MRNIISKVWRQQIARFVTVGCFNTLLDFTLLNILTAVVGLPTLVANTVSVSIGITASYLLNHYVVFRHSGKPTLKNYARFFVITGVSVIGIQNLVIYTVSHLIVVQPGQGATVMGHFISGETIELNVAKALAVLMGMAWNFLLYKYVIFKDDPNTSEPEEMLGV